MGTMRFPRTGSRENFDMFTDMRIRPTMTTLGAGLLALCVGLDHSAGNCPCPQGQWCLYDAPVTNECSISTIPYDCECENGLCPETFWFSPHPNALTARLVETLPCPPFPSPCDGCTPVGYCYVNMKNPCLWHYPCKSILGYTCDPENPCFHHNPEVISVPGWWKTIIPCCVDTV